MKFLQTRDKLIFLPLAPLVIAFARAAFVDHKKRFCRICWVAMRRTPPPNRQNRNRIRTQTSAPRRGAVAQATSTAIQQMQQYPYKFPAAGLARPVQRHYHHARQRRSG